MKVVIPGGSGHVGTVLARTFHQQGWHVVVLSRQPTEAAWLVLPWDAQSLGPWADELDGADVVINLAGRSVNCRYHAENRRLIKESRVSSTRIVGEAIARSSRPPPVWLQPSTATIYAHRFDAPNDEMTGILGCPDPITPDTWRFSFDVARSWEEAMDQSSAPHTRKVKLRTTMMMSPDRGGIFDMLLSLVRRGLGGRAGNGRQYVSWIHDQDFVRAVQWLIVQNNLDGPINLAAPNPLPNADFMQILRQAWATPIGLPAPEWLLEIGAFFMRTETELVLKSRRVVPRRLLDAGFSFQFPGWAGAASDLCNRWCTGNSRV